jgi:hypothetical protein
VTRVPSSRGRVARQRRHDLRLLGGALAAFAALAAFLRARAWYLDHEEGVDSFLRVAIPTLLAILVLVAAGLVRARWRESREHQATMARRRKAEQRRQELARLEAEQPELPPPATLYRHYGDWWDPEKGAWLEDVLLYVGEALDWLARYLKHSEGSDWLQRVTRTTYEHFESYVDPEYGYVVSAKAQARAAEEAAIKAERPKHNIIHNGELGRQERARRAALRQVA